MNDISLGKIYDNMIAVIGYLAIPRETPRETRFIINNAGKSTGAHKKANALFKRDILSSDTTAGHIKLVKEGIIIPGGDAIPEKALEMLDALSLYKLQDEISYLKKMLEYSIIYKVCKNLNYEIKTLRNEIHEKDFEEACKTIHGNYEAEYLDCKAKIDDKLINDYTDMYNNCSEPTTIPRGRMSLEQILTICIAKSVSELSTEIISNKKKEIKEKQDEIKKYIDELINTCSNDNLDNIMKAYFRKVWEESNLMEVKEQNDKRTQLEKYVYPYFTYKSEKKNSPLLFEKEKNFKRIIIAESGLGKSSYLNTITSVSIYKDILENVSIDENNLGKLETIKKSIIYTGDITPILILAGEYKNAGNTANNILQCIIGRPKEKDYVAWIDSLKKQTNRRIVIMVDALDEVEYNLRNEFVNNLNDFVEKFDYPCLLVTCRPIEKSFFDNSSLARGIEQWNLEPFDRERMIQFIDEKIKSGTKAIDVDANDIFDNINKNEYLKDLIRNPYILEQILIHYYSSGCTAYSAIDSVVKNLIDCKWSKLIYMYPAMDSQKFSIILGGIAHKMMIEEDGNKNFIIKSDMIKEFEKITLSLGWENIIPEKMFREVVSNMNTAAGLLIYENNGYKFQYPVIEHFLSAKWIWHKLKNLDCMEKEQKPYVSLEIEELLPINIDDSWADVIIMLFSVLQKEFDNKEFYSTILFRRILSMGMGNEMGNCKKYIDKIFNNLIHKCFGNNNVIKETELKSCIIHYLSLNEEHSCNSEIVPIEKNETSM